MERTVGNLHLEVVSKDNTYQTICVTGLSVEEMNDVLENGNDALGNVMEKNGAGSVFTSWHNGYGIYSIRHVGGHLFVQIGNSCE